ncbi:condensin complex subunit 3 [Cephus cinctus]|uniref:Condensin complex subunit 3 n=1 Tax=Cephus cinctus TaxID=211228 RepID=A0AAJ7BGH8_CEPCN|nr:condensin complex subunit 3 [Cephus cinctus]
MSNSYKKINKFISDIFYNVQFNKTCHQNYLKKLKAYYLKVDPDVFIEYFILCLMVPLTRSEIHPHVENTLGFAAKFAVNLQSSKGDESDEDMCPFLLKLFDFLLDHHNSKDTAVRYRVCYFVNMLLNGMGENAFLEDVLCDKISANMMERLLDKSPKVRAQAVFALHRLQDPADEQCPIIKMFIFHLSKDPHAEVRKAVLTNMGKSQKTLQAALKRTRDINDTVRKIAYIFISKITVRSLTIKQREQLLSDGLKDRSEIVRDSVKKVLLPSWLQHFQGDYVNLLRALDAENAMETGILVLNTLFQADQLRNLMAQIPIDPDTKLIPHEKLQSEIVLYWRCLVDYLRRSSYTDELEEFLPELSIFCTYIREYLALLSSKEYQPWEQLTQKIILNQLFEIAKIYDLSDESGRANLKQLIFDALMTEHCSQQVTESIVKYLEVIIPDVDSRLNSLTHIISELRMPLKQQVTTQISEEELHTINMKRAKLKVKLIEVNEEEYEAIHEKDYMRAAALKEQIEDINRQINELPTGAIETTNEPVCEEKNDRETMIMCLGIMCAMMEVPSVTTLTPNLRTLMTDMALPSFDHADDTVHLLALKAVAICCLLDKELAKKHIMMFFLQFSIEQDNQDIWIMALKSIFDLLLFYGMEYFDIMQNEEENVSSNKSKNRTVKLYSNTDDTLIPESTVSETENNYLNIIKILTGLLDNANQDLRTIATEGLCKLLLNRRISSATLLSRLIILWHNPITEGDIYLRQCLCSFFNSFVVHIPDCQEMLEQAFLPTLQTLANAPDTSPLQEINPHAVAKLILSWTKPGIQKISTQTYYPHKNLTYAILAEILKLDSDIDQDVLIKSLKYLELSAEERTDKDIREAVDNVMKMIQQTDKRLMKFVQQFRMSLYEPNVDQDHQTQENSENDTDDEQMGECIN